MPDTETVEGNREIQRTEARSRDTAELPQADKDLNAGADTIETDAAEVTYPPETRQPQPPPEPAPAPEPRVVRSPFDQRRQAIIDSYRTTRNQQVEDADDNEREIRTLSMDGIPRELTEGVDNREEVEDTRQPPEPVAVRPPRENEQAQPPAEDRKHRLVVRGEERFVSDAELIEHAQKALAGDDYLGDAKSALQRAREVESRLNAALDKFSGQPTPAGTHSTGQVGQPGDPQAQPGATPPVDPFEAVVEQLQYGDKTEAARLLREAVANTVAPLSAEQVRLQRLQTEHQASTRTVEAFTKSHDEIAKDPMAQAAIRARVIDLQREDIKSLNIMPEDKIPGHPDDLANMHMRLRTDRAPVRDVQTILDRALTDYQVWRGQNPAQQPAPAPARQQHQQPSPQQPAPAQPEPQQTQVRRVEVSLNRDARRAAIPQQPERTVAPRPNPQPPQQAQPKDRSEVVKAMADRRNALRGKVTT